MRLTAVPAAVRRTPAWLISAVVGLAVLSPALLTQRAFGSDWGNHAWLMWAQGESLRSLGKPTFFLQTETAFEPWFAFYGGTLYVLGGALGIVLGPLTAYLVLHVVIVAAALGGFVWLARQVGLHGWRAHVPGVLWVTSSIYVTDLYGRGDLPESVALSMLPLVVAGALHLARAERWTPGPVALFAGAVVLFTGSHGLTLLWGGVFVLVVLGLLAFALPQHVDRRGVLGVAGLGALATLVNAWFLAVAAAYGTKTIIGDRPDEITQQSYTTARAVFDVFRDTAQLPLSATVQAQLPVLALAWAALVAAVFWSETWRAARRLLAGLTIAGTVLGVLVLVPSSLDLLPSLWRHLQFPYRLVPYLTLVVCGLVVVGLLLVARARADLQRFPLALLVLVVALSAGFGVAQAWNSEPAGVPPDRDRGDSLISVDRKPVGWYAPLDYADASAPVVRPTLPGRIELAVEPGVEGVRASLPVARRGTIATNVAAGDYLVRVAGARPVGRTEEGLMVVAIDDPSVPVRFLAKRSLLLDAARIVSILATLGLAGLLVGLTVQRRRPSALSPA